MSLASLKTLLIIDDDRLFCRSVVEVFRDHDIKVFTVHTKKEGKAICAEQKIDVVLLDQKLPDGLGIELCEPILSAHDQTKIIFITAYPSFDNAITAIRSGAFDYLLKPVEIEELAMTVEKAFRTLELERVEQIQKFTSQQENKKNILIGSNGGLKEVFRLVNLSANEDASVLITGETGTGKNVVAKCIHYNQSLKSSGFVGINCAALPENLIESELFGHEKGSFTGALSDKKGVFEMAQGGTLFLDEIGEIPLKLQSKLLGILDDKKLKRVGGHSIRKLDVRIIAATNIEIEKAIQKSQFREDLYYRLSVIRIHVPPLRSRPEDIPALCYHFLKQSAKNQQIDLKETEIEKMMNYHWPGNVRELKNVIERSIILKKKNEIHPSLLLGDYRQIIQDSTLLIEPDKNKKSLGTLAQIEENHILLTLDQMNHNHTHTATSLGISRSTLIRKLKEIKVAVLK